MVGRRLGSLEEIKESVLMVAGLGIRHVLATLGPEGLVYT